MKLTRTNISGDGAKKAENPRSIVVHTTNVFFCIFFITFYYIFLQILLGSSKCTKFNFRNKKKILSPNTASNLKEKRLKYFRLFNFGL